MSDYPYRLVIFDFDGTLADSFDWLVAHFNAAAGRFGYRPFDLADLPQLRGMNSRELMRRQSVPVWKLPAIAVYFRQCQGENLSAIPLFDSVAETIEALHERGVKLALVTSNAESNVRQVLGANLSRRIDHFDCGSSLFGKAAKFRRLVRSAGVKPAQVLSIGDELRDIEAARAVGLNCGAVMWGYADPARLSQERPDHLFATPMDIAALARE